MAKGKLIKYPTLLYEGTDDKIIKMINDERNKAGFIRDLLYQELERRKGNLITIDIQSYNKLTNYSHIQQPISNQIENIKAKNNFDEPEYGDSEDVLDFISTVQ